MKKNYSLSAKTLFLSLFTLLFSSCINTLEDSLVEKPDDLIDVDGNVYETVIIGNQIWMAENLRVEHYRDSSKINSERVYNYSTDIEADILYYCNDINYIGEKFGPEKYGALYSWVAIKNLKGIAPVGWHVAATRDWKELIAYLGGEDIAGACLKSNELETGKEKFWKNDSTANNSSGFNARPGGYSGVTFNGTRYHHPSSRFIGEQARFWIVTDSVLPSSYLLTIGEGNIKEAPCSKEDLFYPLHLSIRCVKDK